MYDDDFDDYDRLPRRGNVSATQSIKMDPAKFYSIIKVMKGITPQQLDKVDAASKTIVEFSNIIEENKNALFQAKESILNEIKRSTRVNPFSSMDDHREAINPFMHTLSGDFIGLVYDILVGFSAYSHGLLTLSDNLKPQSVMVAGDGFDGNLSFEKLQQITFETQLNMSAIQQFIGALQMLDEAKTQALNLGKSLTKAFERFYQTLLDRHSVKGIKIHGNPLVTDIAMSVFENIDAHGEIAAGKKPDELSAYSMHKAEAIVSAVKNGTIQDFLSSPETFMQFIVSQYRSVWRLACELYDSYKDVIRDMFAIIGVPRSYKRMAPDAELDHHIRALSDLDPMNVDEKEDIRVLSSEERFSLSFQNETLEHLADLLSDKNKSIIDVVQYVLGRKQELRKFFQDENSFYICKIGGGNMFTGEAPGALAVIPGVKPVARLNEIVGSGIDDVKQFIKHIDDADQWHDLFIATSPSRSADKANVLLIGPPGCGKSELMRGIADDKKSVSIYAQGSDFLTCWKGEAEKNPRRLFEAAVKIQKESKKHVHILIDEIDSILKKQEFVSHGDFNLTLEFQMLMDGILNYPGISVWGTTNSPEKIPMPMIRRFSMTKIVGELSVEDRVKLFKHFVDFFLPTQNFEEDDWQKLAVRMEGATGDVMRKVVDYVWRTKISNFVTNHKKEAVAAIDRLNEKEKFDIKRFDDKDRHNFKQTIKQYVAVTPEDLNKSIDIHLQNIAIRAEIDEAIECYERANAFLAQLKKSELNA